MEFLKKEIEKNIELYDEIYKTILKYDNIVLFRHTHPDYDALGSQFGLYYWLKENFPNKKIKTSGDNSVVFSGNVFPLVDKVYDSDLANPFLGIITDVSEPNRISDPRFSKAETLIKIDHHLTNTTLAKLHITESDKVSCSEIVATMFIYLEEKYGLKFSNKAVRYLYTGIVGDSGRFLFGQTKPSTFEVAANLINRDIDIVDIYETMYEKELDSLKCLKYVMNTFTLTPKGVLYYILTNDDLNRFNLRVEQGKENVNFFANFKGVNIWMSITEDISDHKFRISMRSRNYVINEISEKYGGGGHHHATGCELKSLDDLPNLIKDLEELIDNQEGK